jgi:hypothetical protein
MHGRRRGRRRSDTGTPNGSVRVAHAVTGFGTGFDDALSAPLAWVVQPEMASRRGTAGARGGPRAFWAPWPSVGLLRGFGYLDKTPCLDRGGFPIETQGFFVALQKPVFRSMSGVFRGFRRLTKTGFPTDRKTCRLHRPCSTRLAPPGGLHRLLAELEAMTRGPDTLWSGLSFIGGRGARGDCPHLTRTAAQA